MHKLIIDIEFRVHIEFGEFRTVSQLRDSDLRLPLSSTGRYMYSDTVTGEVEKDSEAVIKFLVGEVAQLRIADWLPQRIIVCGNDVHDIVTTISDREVVAIQRRFQGVDSIS